MATLNGDFSAVLKVAGISDAHQVNDRFNKAWAALLSRGLTYIDESARSIARVSIAKRWWHLVLDELRSRGRRV